MGFFASISNSVLSTYAKANRTFEAASQYGVSVFNEFLSKDSFQVGSIPELLRKEREEVSKAKSFLKFSEYKRAASLQQFYEKIDYARPLPTNFIYKTPDVLGDKLHYIFKYTWYDDTDKEHTSYYSALKRGVVRVDLVRAELFARIADYPTGDPSLPESEEDLLLTGVREQFTVL